jgi:hypothetical protein
MKFVRLALVTAIIVAATLGISTHSLAAGNPPGTVNPAECALNAWSPELFSFYGDKATVLAKFQALDRNLLKHRTFAFVVQTHRGAKLTFFELQGKISEGKMVDLASTTGKSFNDFSNQVTTALLSNTGEKCAGMLTKDLLANYTQGQMEHSLIPRPSTAGEAFQYALDQADGEYMQATFILLC